MQDMFERPGLSPGQAIQQHELEQALLAYIIDKHPVPGEVIDPVAENPGLIHPVISHLETMIPRPLYPDVEAGITERKVRIYIWATCIGELASYEVRQELQAEVKASKAVGPHAIDPTSNSFFISTPQAERKVQAALARKGQRLDS